MKRVVSLSFILLFFIGCSKTKDRSSQAIALRQKILNAESCSFTAAITADYIDHIYTFRTACTSDHYGVMKFEVLWPDTISGISGSISNSQSSLTFDDTVLAFSPLADGYISPVCAPWVFMQALRSGYIHSIAETDEGMFLSIDDSYQDDAVQVDIQFDKKDNPLWVDFVYKGRRVISMAVEGFTIQ